eukprot:scaffold22673_cov109-Isochrysis_galbana.AAC.1
MNPATRGLGGTMEVSPNWEGTGTGRKIKINFLREDLPMKKRAQAPCGSRGTARGRPSLYTSVTVIVLYLAAPN